MPVQPHRRCNALYFEPSGANNLIRVPSSEQQHLYWADESAVFGMNECLYFRDTPKFVQETAAFAYQPADYNIMRSSVASVKKKMMMMQRERCSNSNGSKERSPSATPSETREIRLEISQTQAQLEKKLKTIDGMIGVLAHLLNEKEASKMKSQPKPVEDEVPVKEEVKKKKKHKKGKKSSKKESDDSDSSDEDDQVKSVKKKKNKKKSKNESGDSDSSKDENKEAVKKKPKTKKVTRDASTDSDSSREEEQPAVETVKKKTGHGKDVGKIVKKKQKSKKMTKEASSDSDSSQEEQMPAKPVKKKTGHGKNVEKNGKKKPKSKKVSKEVSSSSDSSQEEEQSTIEAEKKKPVHKKDIEKDMYLIGTTLDQPGLSLFCDPGFHWCRSCNVFPKTAKEYLLHLHTTEHKETAQIHRGIEYPWHNIERDEDAPLRTMDANIKNPIQGLQFFLPVSSWYCKLCDFWIGDLHCASIHLKSQKHNTEYNKYVQLNPDWLEKWTAARDEGCEKKTRQKRLLALAKKQTVQKTDPAPSKTSAKKEKEEPKKTEAPQKTLKATVVPEKQKKKEKAVKAEIEKEKEEKSESFPKIERKYRKTSRSKEVKEIPKEKETKSVVVEKSVKEKSESSKQPNTAKVLKSTAVDVQLTELPHPKDVKLTERSTVEVPVVKEEIEEVKEDDDLKREKIIFDLSKKNVQFSKVETTEPAKESMSTVFELSTSMKDDSKPEQSTKEKKEESRKKKDHSSDEDERERKRGRGDRSDKRYEDRGSEGFRRYGDKHRDFRRISPESRRFREIYRIGYNRRDDDRRRGRDDRSPIHSRFDRERDRRRRDRSRDRSPEKFRDRSRDEKSPLRKPSKPVLSTLPKPTRVPPPADKKKDVESSKKSDQTSAKDTSKPSKENEDTKEKTPSGNTGNKLPFIKPMPTWKKKSNEIAEEIERVHAMSKKASEEAVSLDTYLSQMAADEGQPEKVNSDTVPIEGVVVGTATVEMSAPPVLVSSVDEVAAPTKPTKKKKGSNEILPQDFQDALNILFPQEGARGSAPAATTKPVVPAAVSSSVEVSSDTAPSAIDSSTYEQALLMSGATNQFAATTDPASMQYWQYMYGAQAQAMAAYSSMGYDMSSGYDMSTMYAQSTQQVPPATAKKPSKPVSAISDEDLAMLGIEKDDNVVKSFRK